jgi:hypothetical protein
MTRGIRTMLILAASAALTLGCSSPSDDAHEPAATTTSTAATSPATTPPATPGSATGENTGNAAVGGNAHSDNGSSDGGQANSGVVNAPTATPPAGGGSDTPARPGSSEVAVDPELFRSSGANGEGLYLTSPTGNVSCALFPNGSSLGYVGCQAVSSVAPPQGPVCSNADNDKYAIRIDGVSALHFCTTQGIFTTNAARVLQYGEIVTAGSVSCISREEGISCLRTGTNAFLLSRDANTTY